MIIGGILLIILCAYLPPVLPLPDPIYPLGHVAGVILLVVGILFLVLSFFGRPVGGRRYWF